jgi:hypothetical protein
MTDGTEPRSWRPGDVANGHVLGEDGIWRQLPQQQVAPKVPSVAAKAVAAAMPKAHPQADAEDTLWSAIGKPITGIGAGKYRLTAHYLFFEKGTLTTDSQQVPIAAVQDVDVKQSMTQKTRNVGTIVVRIQRPHGLELVRLEDITDFREGQRLINETAHAARYVIQRNQNTMRYEGVHPGMAHAPVPTPAPAQASVAPAPEVPLTDQLVKLGELRDAGILTEEEFAAKKTDILSRI